MASQLLRIQMAGGGPYGFRLLGGDKNPLTVAKIRPSSKAQVAGLLEGDVILALNNISSQGLSHSAATSLMEGNSSALTVHVLRGMSALKEVDSAMATLGSEVKRLTAEEASALVQNSATSGSDHVTNGSSSEPYFRLQAPPSGGSLKQLRIARRESQSGDTIQTPGLAAALSSENHPPGYYAREERTSTDGGKTTRIVEEVKTEKFGGTTLTKVTKQEFSSYKTSSGVDPRFQPELFSVARNEEEHGHPVQRRSEEEQYGHPVLLGASSDGGGAGGGGGQLRDERGWKTTTSVHKSSVRTEPYEVRIDTTQDPTKTYIIYQDGSTEDLQRPPHDVVVGLGQQQPIPAIEVQFHPSESDFVVHAKPPRVGANSNFEIRVGNEVTFQPKAQTSYEATQSHPEFHPTLKVHEQSIPIQSGTYSKFSHESTKQTSYGTHPSHEPPQSGYLIKQTTRTQPLQTKTRSESHSRYDTTNQQFGHTNDSRPPPARPTVRFSAEPEYSDDPRPALHLQHAAKLHPDAHFRPGSDNADPRVKPGTSSQPQPIIAQFHLGYNSVQQPSYHTKSGYTAEYQPGTHLQHGYNEELQPVINSQLQRNPEPQPRTQSQHGYNPEPKPQSQYGYNTEPKPQSQYGYNPESQPKPQSQYGYNPESQPKPQSQYGYNTQPEPKAQPQYGGYNPEPQLKPQSQYGYNKEQHPNTQDQFGYSQEPSYPYQPRNHLEHENKPKQQQQPEYNKPDNHLYRPEPEDHATNPQYGYNSQQEPHLPPSQSTCNPEPKHKATGAYHQNTYEPEPPPSVAYNAYPSKESAAPFNRQAEAPFYDKAPATQTSPPQRGKKLPHGGPGGPGSYNPPEGLYRGPPGVSRQLDPIERVEIATAPKWIPGSKLPTKQPSKPPVTYNSQPPPTVDLRGPPTVDLRGPPTGDPRGQHPNNPPAVVSADGYYDQSPEGGWHEAPVAGVKNRPNVSFSRVYDPTKQPNETDQSFEYGSAPPPNLKYGGDDSYYGREAAEEIGQYGGWSESSGGQSAAGHYPAQGNVWRPSSGYGPSVAEERDRSRGFGDGPAPPPPGPPPPPAPPLLPGGFASTQPIGFCVEPTPLAPPPPVAPPIDLLKAYRGHSSSDRYGSTSLEERVKMANSVAHSVLAPENQNTRGQKMFLRRREHSHKWTFHGPDPAPEEPSQQDPPPSRSNAWAPKTAAGPPAQPRPPPALAPQQHQLQVRPPVQDYPEVNGRPEQPPSAGGGSASAYSLAEDMAVNSGKGGRLFAKRQAKADQWASAETTGRQGTPQNIRQGAPPPPQSQTGYGSVAVPPSPGYDGSSYGGGVGGGGGGKGAGDGYPVANRLKDMIKPKNTTVIWNQQSAPQSPFAQGGPQATGPSLISAGSSNQNPGAYRQVRFQGTSAISSSPAVKQHFTQVPRFNPKQFGNRATVSQAAGVTDL